ncbi:hypothetical protein RJ640_013058 [Escallonia rubra]|uniref:ATPase V1 complex subunit H C-terminal domain-containing protein n=1 Tax=Escallonia rubra TaxID=112253 RepID=A0AA88UBX7_9ASTE|nr:hypothetical protein RJ640_013058 [Escallonia rubra]
MLTNNYPVQRQVLKRDIPWEMYTTSALINGTGLQLLRRYDKKADSYRMQLLDDDGPAYARVFVSILRNIFKEETVEYVLALVDEVLTANPMRARLFHDRSLAEEDTYEPFLRLGVTRFSNSPQCLTAVRLLRRGNWSVQEKSCRILCLIVSARPKAQDASPIDGEASKSKMILTGVDDVLKGVVKWLCGQVVRVVVLTFKNLLSNRNFGSQMVDLGLAQIVQNLKAQAWSDEDLLEALNQLEGGLKDNTKKWSYFEKYRREVFLGPLDWSPIHKDPNFWRENVENFEDYNFQVLPVPWSNYLCLYFFGKVKDLW